MRYVWCIKKSLTVHKRLKRIGENVQIENFGSTWEPNTSSHHLPHSFNQTFTFASLYYRWWKIGLATPKQEHHSQKSLLCHWWYIKGVIHYELIEHGRIITADIHCQQRVCVNEVLCWRCSNLIETKGAFLQHVNIGTHTEKKSKKTHTQDR